MDMIEITGVTLFIVVLIYIWTLLIFRRIEAIEEKLRDIKDDMGRLSIKR